MTNNAIIYLLSSSLSSDTYIYYGDNNYRLFQDKVNTFLNQVLIDDLTTLKGRLKAIRIKYGMRKNIPIYLNNYLVFFRLIEDDKLIYINAMMVLRLTKDGDNTVIYFKNDSKLLVKRKVRFIKSQWERSLLIEKSNENVY